MKILTILLMAPLAILSPPTAHADGDGFVAELDQYNIPYRTKAAAIEFGQVICKTIDSGTDVKVLLAAGTSDGVYTRGQMGTMIGAAVANLCPYDKQLVNEQITGGH